MNSKVIKQYIESLFPCQVGFVKPRIFNELKGNLELSQNKGYDSGLVPGTIKERINPFIYQKDLKTIIVIIFPYTHQDDYLSNKTHITSRSSWGIDYHEVIKECLGQVTEYIRNEYQGNSLILVDNHNLHDRHLAYLAGHGNYGKNTLLINKQYGSFFFIGSILTNIELEDEGYHQPIYEDLCMDCTRCLRACPTDAISEERFINSKRCLSYITQSKDIIEDEFIGKLKKFSFGCDFCQLACPYNKDIETDPFYRFKPTGAEQITVEKIYQLSNKEFKNQYGHLAGAFRGKNVILRNALVISGNNKNREDLKYLDEIDDHGNEYLKQAIEYARSKVNKGE